MRFSYLVEVDLGGEARIRGVAIWRRGIWQVSHVDEWVLVSLLQREGWKTALMDRRGTLVKLQEHRHTLPPQMTRDVGHHVRS